MQVFFKKYTLKFFFFLLNAVNQLLAIKIKIEITSKSIKKERHYFFSGIHLTSATDRSLDNIRANTKR